MKKLLSLAAACTVAAALSFPAPAVATPSPGLDPEGDSRSWTLDLRSGSASLPSGRYPPPLWHFAFTARTYERWTLNTIYRRGQSFVFNVYVRNHQGPARTITVRSRGGELHVLIFDRHHHVVGSGDAYKFHREVGVSLASGALKLPLGAELRWSVTLMDHASIHHHFFIPFVADQFPDKGLLRFSG
jgi:hypothetical protein